MLVRLHPKSLRCSSTKLDKKPHLEINKWERLEGGICFLVLGTKKKRVFCAVDMYMQPTELQITACIDEQRYRIPGISTLALHFLHFRYILK